MTYGEHLEVLRRMLIRVAATMVAVAAGVFACKEEVFRFLLAPGSNDFFIYSLCEEMLGAVGLDVHFREFHIHMIATELSSQFMTHVTTSLYLSLLIVSPYIVYELFRFVTPALYENERRYSVQTAIAVLMLFGIGVVMSYCVLFPMAVQFLANYNVSPEVESTITISSYISTFVTLTFLMGIVFQLPVVAFFLAKAGVLASKPLKKYRRYAFLIICVVSAIITPPDVMTLVLVTLPLYGLYEVSIRIVAREERTRIFKNSMLVSVG